MKLLLKTRLTARIALSGFAFLSYAPTSLADNTVPNPEPDPKEVEFFEKKIRPILVENCYVCHSEHHKEAGGLRVDDYRALTIKGRNGFAIIPGDAENSQIIKRVTHVDDSRIMPPDHRLSDEQIADLKSWIDRGAAWPPLVFPGDVDQTLEEGVVPHEDLKEHHWAWQPLIPLAPPRFADASSWGSWARTDVDSFIAAKLEEQNLQPVKDASKSVLLRRLTYDLTGLPPTEDELLAYLLDDSAIATERVVDRLLESSAFGERWGRHWLDVARYGESTGSARNLPYPHAWRYRDYVVEAFNKDKPFNEFLQEQIAGDLLSTDSEEKKKEQLVATGFLALGVKDVNQRFTVRYEMDNVDEQIDTVTRSVLGLTVSCARCHDHKFDPISTRDYYALAGIFTSTELQDALRNQMGGGGLAYYVPARLIKLSETNPDELSPELQAQVNEKKDAFEKAREKFVNIRDSVKAEDRTAEHTKKLQQARQAMNRRQAELVALTDPAALGPVALGVRDSKNVADTEIRIRGEAEKRGPVVPRGFLTLLDYLPANKIPDNQSGRLELAHWLTQDSNPLTSRVIVNRIWKNLFSEGLVRTVDNFGSTGDTPTHPELLDYLADKFVRDGWSHKKLIRSLVLSRTYQLASEETEQSIAKDPSNQYLWRHAPRRLDAEELRDSLLLVSGTLQRGPNADPASKDLPVIEIRNNGNEAISLIEAAGKSQHRSLYLPMVRGILHDVLQVFDFAEQGMVTGKRVNTTVAPQALFLLNDPFIRHQSLAYARELLKEDRTPIDERIASAYRRSLQRQPTASEVERARNFLDNYESDFEKIIAGELEKPQNDSAEPAPAKLTSLLNELISEESSTNIADSVAPTELSNNDATNNDATNAAAPEDSRGEEAKLNVDVNQKTEETPEEAALAAFLQAIFSSAEFRYVR